MTPHFHMTVVAYSAPGVCLEDCDTATVPTIIQIIVKIIKWLETNSGNTTSSMDRLQILLIV